MTSKKAFSIISIACFISVLFIPIGIVLMIFYTDWKKKTKTIIAAVLTVVYLALAFLTINLQPNQYSKGVTLPVPVESEITQNESETNHELENIEELNTKQTNKKSKTETTQNPSERLPKSVTRKRGDFLHSRYFYMFLFFIFMLLLIIYQNVRGKNKSDYENPYMDTDKIKLPLNVDSKLPMVHFQKLRINKNEKIYFATQTTKKEDEGDFIVTNQRVVVLSKTGDYEFPLTALSAVSSVSNTVMLLTCGERKYYIFFPEGQLKYALAIVRWAYSNQG